MTKLGTTSPTPGPAPDVSTWRVPGNVVALAPASDSDIVIPAGVVTRIAVRNARRICIAITSSLATPNGLFVAPWSDPQTFGFPIDTTTRILSFTLDEIYGLLSNDWYAYHAAGATVRVTQMVRPA